MADTHSQTIAMPPHSTFAASAIRGAYLGLLIGDALAAPVHWFYQPSEIVRLYGTLKDFVPTPQTHPGSIMAVSNTGGGGRGKQTGSVIGDVINHGKKQYWGQSGVHYHRGLRAGENTLNAQCARVVARSISASPQGVADPSSILAAYVTFMTTPGSHTDTYADTSHRMFFANWARGVPPAACADNDGHNTDSAGGLCSLAPVALAALARELRTAPTPASSFSSLSTISAKGEAGEAGKSAATTASPPAWLPGVQVACVAHLALTHRSAVMARYASIYGELVARAALAPRGVDHLRPLIAVAAKQAGFDVAATVAAYPPGIKGDKSAIGAGGAFSSACYISDSLPSSLFLAYKYAGDAEAALVANTNVGGDNVGRGAIIGGLMGAHWGEGVWPARWRELLFEGPAIHAEAAALAVAVGAAAGV